MKRWIIVIVVIALVAGGGWFYLRGRMGQAQASLNEGYATSPVIRGEIEAIVSATGSVSVPSTETVAFANTGEIVEIVVHEGDYVTKGQVLARLDDTDARLQVEQARASLRIAEAQLAQTRKGPTEAEIGAAQAAVDSAKASLAALYEGPTAREKQLAALAIDQAKNSRWGAQASRDATAGSKFAEDASKDQAEANVLNAEVAVQIAEIKYEQIFEGARASAIAQAKAQISQTEANLLGLQDRPSPESIAVAEAQVAQARVSVTIAEQRLEDLTLQAPIDGHLVIWDAYVGQTVGPQNTLGTVIDDSYYEITVSIDETDIGDIAPNQIVRLTFDAFPDHEILGHISDVATLGNNVQGIVTYDVTVQIEPTDLGIKALMTAAVDIVTERKENVLLVSNRALRRDQQGKYVEILKPTLGGTPTSQPVGLRPGSQMPSPVERVNVETGVSNDEYTEVLSGLDEGQEVVISRPRGSIFENASGGGPFGG